MTAEPSATTADAHGSVLTPSEALPSDSIHVKGPNFDSEIGLQDLLTGYETIGFQATGLARAIKIINRMVSRPVACSDLEVRNVESRQLALDSHREKLESLLRNLSASSSDTPPT
jgi:hypothetical protein